MTTPDHPDWWTPVGGLNSIESLLERRSLIANNGDDIVGWADPSGTRCRGKFYPRGCRGFIDDIELYLRSQPLGSIIDVYISPEPGMGPFHERQIVLGAASPEAWYPVDFSEFWNYDSLFIWIQSNIDDGEIAYDEGLPWDAYYSANDGLTWIHEDRRYWMRVIMKGETPGDVPISGTINNIEIMRSGAGRSDEVINVPPGVGAQQYIEIRGSGKATYIAWRPQLTLDRNALIPFVECDGVQCFPLFTTFVNIEAGLILNTREPPMISWGQWNPSEQDAVLISALHFPFINRLRIGYQNTDAVNWRTGQVYFLYELQE